MQEGVRGGEGKAGVRQGRDKEYEEEEDKEYEGANWPCSAGHRPFLTIIAIQVYATP